MTTAQIGRSSLATMPSQAFARTARIVCERSATLLGARVSVVDHRGTIIATSRSNEAGTEEERSVAQRFAIPAWLDNQLCEVVISGTASSEIVSPRLAQAIIELIINEAALVTRLPDRNELKDKFIHDLLRAPAEDEAETIRQGQILGIDLTRPRAVILIDAADYILAPDESRRGEHGEARARRRSEHVIESIVNFFHLPDSTICAYIGDGEVVVLKASSTQDLAAWADRSKSEEDWSPSWANLAALKRAGAGLLARLRQDTGATISAGIGRYHPGVRGLARSYEDARAALSIGRRFHGHNQVHCLDELGIAAFVGVSDERTKLDLSRYLLGPLDDEPELLETLDVFFEENRRPSSTSNRLSIHRNTLAYRLDKITSLTGLDVRRFDDAVRIRLALLLRSLQSTSN